MGGQAPRIPVTLIAICLTVFLAAGIYTELRLVDWGASLGEWLLSDYECYEQALSRARAGEDPCSVRHLPDAARGTQAAAVVESLMLEIEKHER